ncbi:amino acid/polyamine transporter I [Massariosphaeria phaeospora]|uniref:Amino acid/polyamine transporter I n=1 Tax=Massariosphaeria phaeospora TaxID=100035 RepID=A0A7C8I6K8_9PLEO|nr:amino acid/polyamine transporter I [Massariosphaeria phaeospora]
MPKDHFELQAMGTDTDVSFPAPNSRSGSSSDDFHLQRLGKRPLLNRSFGFMSILGFTCSVLISWEGILVTSVGGLLNGGPAGVVWGFLVNWLGTLATFATIAELSSIAPTAGGQYHWVATLAPAYCRNFLAYLTAWLTTAAWQVMAASTGYLLATLLQGMMVMSRPDHVPKPWHTILLMWAIMTFAVLMNSITSRTLARFEGLVFIFHIVGFFAVLIPLVYLAPHGEPSAVFTTFLNLGGWDSQTVSFFVGLPASAASLMGADSAVHMSEEIQSAATVVPQALMYTIMINGVLAMSMLIALLFCTADLSAALEAQLTMFYPFLEIFRQTVKSKTGACIMASIVLVMGIASGVGVYASASRMLWSFSRDRGMPFHDQLTKLSKNSLPVPAILTTLVITMLLSLIVLGSSVAFNAFISLSVAALYSSYLLVCILLLYRRLTGAFLQNRHSDSQLAVLDPDHLAWGPWRLPEPFGTINNLFACVYLSLLWFWSFWPPVASPTAQTANFSGLVFGSVVLLSIAWYMFRARHSFEGPVREVELEDMLPNVS